MKAPIPSGRVRFGVFEVNLRSGELHKHGIKVKLHDQPFQILAMLLEHPGEVVTREQLRQKLWPADTFVDFDVGLNSAVKKLRDALGDSAEAPRFVETLPRRGYRFIAPVDDDGRPGAPARVSNLKEALPTPAEPGMPGVAKAAAGAGLRKLWLGAIALVGLAVLLFSLNVGGWRQRVFGRAGAARIQSIVVLPLENLTGDTSQEYFVDGMTDALITDLARVSSLRVISRTSAMSYKRAKKPLPQIARELNVDAVVEGSVVRSGNRVRINAQLIQAVPERHLWAKAYERDLADVVTLQGEMARAIATEIEIKLTPKEQARLAQARPVNPEAYEAYLKGRFYWNRRTPEGYQKSIEYFEQALQKDPAYALAYAGLADSYNMLGFSLGEVMPPKEAAIKAKAAALKALQIDDTLAEAHAALGFIKNRYDWDWAGAEREFQRAIELNPGYATAYHWYALHLGTLGQRGEAYAAARHAQQLDPLSPNTNRNLAGSLSSMGQYDQAIEQYRKALDLFPAQFNLHSSFAETLVRVGRYDEAIAKYKRAIELSGGHPNTVLGLALGYAAAGRKAEAEKIFEELKRAAPGPRAITYPFALLSAALGRKDEAFYWLDRAYQERSGGMVLLKGDAWLDPLRSDPRFKALLARVGLPPD